MFSPNKGFVLIATLLMASVISLVAIGLFSMTNLDNMIAGNKRRSAQAAMAASSGLNHFMALNIPVSNIVQSLRSQSRSSDIIIPRTSLIDYKTYYTVEVTRCCNKEGALLPENTVIIKSTGVYHKSGRVIAKKLVLATVTYK